ncbi:MAG: winged helix-turn-helix transcriptional regulator [Rhizobiales bacterium]|nr:winged helix-turn-helix transcriptional regulator [Hyphomicrobiales bacterium]
MIDSNVFKALADPTRRAVFEQLARKEKSVRDLAAELPVSQPAVSQHLAVLREAGLVAERRHGRFTYYRTAPDALASLAEWVDRYRVFWPERVEKLKEILKEMDE